MAENVPEVGHNAMCCGYTQQVTEYRTATWSLWHHIRIHWDDHDPCLTGRAQLAVAGTVAVSQPTALVHISPLASLLQTVTQPDMPLQGRSLVREPWSTGAFFCRRSSDHGSCARPVSA